MSPEEQELTRLQAEQAELEDRIAAAELLLSTTTIETAQFQQRYYQTVGQLYVKLDKLTAQIAAARAKRNPEDAILKGQAHAATRQARASSEEAGLIEGKPKPPPMIASNLKEAYRRAVKAIHPDLAISDLERKRRTELMVLLNLAYEHGDLRKIERLLSEMKHAPEAITGEDVGSRIVKTIRRIAQLRRGLSELQSALDTHQKTEAFQLRTTIESAERAGADPLGDLAHELAKRVARKENELKAIEAQA
jgi:hypothetical protein